MAACRSSDSCNAGSSSTPPPSRPASLHVPAAPSQPPPPVATASPRPVGSCHAASRLQRRPGWRRSTPELEHGASTNATSQQLGAASGCSSICTRGATPARFAAAASCRSRGVATSYAATRPCGPTIAHRASVLPPLPAHASNTVSPAAASVAAATHCEPSSCASNRPSPHARSDHRLPPHAARPPCSVSAHEESRPSEHRSAGTSLARARRRSARPPRARFARSVTGPGVLHASPRRATSSQLLPSWLCQLRSRRGGSESWVESR